jgi:FkbM family methyltransferase
MVCESAVADRDAESVTFVIERQGANSHLGEVILHHAVSFETARASVPMTTLDSFFARVGRSPDVVKINVEGAEVLVLL